MKAQAFVAPLLCILLAFTPASTYVYLEVQGDYCLATVVQTTGSISEYTRETDGLAKWKTEARAEMEVVIKNLDATLPSDLKDRGVVIRMYDKSIPRLKPAAAMVAEDRVRQDCGAFGFHFQFDIRDVNSKRFKYLQTLEISACLEKQPDKAERRKMRDAILRIIAAIR
jgi:hypothetical protein